MFVMIFKYINPVTSFTTKFQYVCLTIIISDHQTNYLNSFHYLINDLDSTFALFTLIVLYFLFNLDAMLLA